MGLFLIRTAWAQCCLYICALEQGADFAPGYAADCRLWHYALFIEEYSPIYMKPSRHYQVKLIENAKSLWRICQRRRRERRRKALTRFLGLLHHLPSYKVAFEICISTTLGLLCCSLCSASSTYFIVCSTEIALQWTIVRCTVECFHCEPLEGSRAHITTITIYFKFSFSV